jgi:hypothetical protein
VQKYYLFARARTPAPPHVFFVVHTNALLVVCSRMVYGEFTSFTNRAQLRTETAATRNCISQCCHQDFVMGEAMCSADLVSWMFLCRNASVFVTDQTQWVASCWLWFSWLSETEWGTVLTFKRWNDSRNQTITFSAILYEFKTVKYENCLVPTATLNLSNGVELKQ